MRKVQAGLLWMVACAVFALPASTPWRRVFVAAGGEDDALQKVFKRDAGLAVEGAGLGLVAFADADGIEPYVREAPKVGRNDPCPCGSGRKYKQCCMPK